jgi:hypothetical protein
MTPAATADTQRQLRPRGVQPVQPPRPHPADLEGQLRDAHVNRRMMQRMQLRSLMAVRRNCAAAHAESTREDRAQPPLPPCGRNAGCVRRHRVCHKIHPPLKVALCAVLQVGRGVFCRGYPSYDPESVGLQVLSGRPLHGNGICQFERVGGGGTIWAAVTPRGSSCSRAGRQHLGPGPPA